MKRKISLKKANELRKEGRLYDMKGNKVESLTPYLPQANTAKATELTENEPKNPQKPDVIEKKTVQVIERSGDFSEILTELKRIGTPTIQTEPRVKKWKFKIVRGDNKLIKEIQAEAMQ